MIQLLKDLKDNEKYDLVIIDNPPLLGLSDSVLTSSYSDGLILVVSIGKVNRSFL